MRDMTEDERKLVYGESKCPACGSGPFNWLEGPGGGMCMNYECARCGLRINVDPIGLVAQIINGPDIKRCEKEGIKLYIPSQLVSQFPRPEMQEIGKSAVASVKSKPKKGNWFSRLFIDG